MQEINLYTQLKKPSFYDINGKKVVWIFCFFCLALLIISLLQGLFLLARDVQRAHLLTQKKQATQVLEHYATLFEKKVIPFEPQTYAEQRLYYKQLQQKLEDTKKITVAFQPVRYLLSISKTITPDVWLTQIDFTEGGKQVQLQGFSMKPEMAMKFSETLAQQTLFKNIGFKVARTEQADKQNLVKFNFNTQETKAAS